MRTRFSLPSSKAGVGFLIFCYRDLFGAVRLVFDFGEGREILSNATTN